jgi:hypothetical protein
MVEGSNMTTIWTISQLDRQTSDGFVTTAHWQATAVDGEHSASIVNTCSWSDGTPTVDYADLTQEQVLGWIWANGVDKDATEAALAAQIAEQKAPKTARGLPWN